MVDEPDQLLAEAERFATALADRLDASVAEGAPIRAVHVGERLVVQPVNANGEGVPIRLTIGGQPRAELRTTFRLGWNSSGEYLAVEYSQFAISIAELREPFIRFEHVRDARSVPAAHVQVHAESGALGYMLALKGSTDAPKVQAVHIPVGGKRFRPCLEDVVEFAVVELGVDAKAGWQDALGAGREEWHRIQLAAAVRDDPETAAEVLQGLGGT